MFGLGKPSDEISNKNKEVIKKSIQNTGVDFEEYTTAYAYFMESGLFSKKMHNYAIALAKDESNFIVVEIDSDGNVGQHTIIDTKDIKSAKRNLQGTIVIKSDKHNDIKFIIPPFTASNAETTYQLPIVQEEEFSVIDGFLKKN